MALLGNIAIVNVPANAADVWLPKTPPLSTPWTQLVGPDNALPEYPRPQLARTKWQNLNGLWEIPGRPATAAVKEPPRESGCRERILVPYPTESALSGISAARNRCGTASVSGAGRGRPARPA